MAKIYKTFLITKVILNLLPTIIIYTAMTSFEHNTLPNVYATIGNESNSLYIGPPDDKTLSNNTNLSTVVC